MNKLNIMIYEKPITYKEKIKLLCKRYNISDSEATKVLDGIKELLNYFVTEKRFIKELETLEKIGGVK